MCISEHLEYGRRHEVEGERVDEEVCGVFMGEARSKERPSVGPLALT